METPKYKSKYKADSIILSTKKLGETDRIIIMLTKEFGIVHAVAKGISKPKAKLGARIQPFMQIRGEFYKGKSLDIIIGASTQFAFAYDIMKDFSKYSIASVMCDTLIKVLPQGLEDEKQFNLLSSAFSMLASGKLENKIILFTYLAKLCDIGGWNVCFYKCVVCSSLNIKYFSIPFGGCVCEKDGVHTQKVMFSQLMSDISIYSLRGDWKKISDISNDKNFNSSVKKLCLLMLEWISFYSEKRIDSSAILENI